MARNATAAAASRPSLKMVDFAGVTPAESKEAVKSMNAVSKTVHMVPIDNIQVAPGFNLRVTDTPDYIDGIQQLKMSIATEGFYNTKPLAGFVSKTKDGKPVLYVTDGHRRLEAAKAAVAEGADIDRLPVILKSPGTTTLDLTVALHKENSGEKLSMLEQAVLAKRLMTSGMTESDVAMRLGLTPRYVADLLTLITAPKEVRALVGAGKVSGTLAVKAIKEHKVDAAEKLEEMVAKAEAKGKGRATAREAAPAPADPTVKMETTTTRVEFTVGQIVDLASIEPFAPLFGDSDWYALTEEPGKAEISEPIELTVRLRRPKKVGEVAEAETVEAAEPVSEEINTAKVKQPKKAKKADDVPVTNGTKKRGRPPVQRDLSGDDDDAGDMPDLSGEDNVTSADLEKLGIADPAADL